jgi:hypothetical protein
MAAPSKAKLRPRAKSLPQALRQFLTPQLWKQAHQAQARQRRRARWDTQPLVVTLLLMSWCTGDSQAEHFEAAKACCVACRPRRRRPGRSMAGFDKATARLPMAALRALAAGLRRQLARLPGWCTDGFIALGCDGTRLQCPRSEVLERFLTWKDKAAPAVWLTAVVHLGSGVPLCWRWGKGTANEREHLRAMIGLLPAQALVVADAGYIGLELARALNERVAFLIRGCSLASFYSGRDVRLESFREGVFWYWSREAKKQGQAPVRVRLIRVRGRRRKGRRGRDVWLMTNVLDRQRLSAAQAGRYYRQRWESEGLFRTYKRMLGKVKLRSRTVALVHREAEGSLLGLQLLLAMGAKALRPAREGESGVVSPRQVLLEVRREIAAAQGGRRAGLDKRLGRARRERRRRTSAKERRVWPGRVPHKPPKPPKILKLTEAEKALIRRLNRLDAAASS